MTKKKLTLEKVEISSFVTSLGDSEKQTIQGEAAGSWLISGCLTSIRCSPQTVLEDKSGTWTKANYVQLCAQTSRDVMTNLGQCPACVNIKQAPAVNEQ